MRRPVRNAVRNHSLALAAKSTLPSALAGGQGGSPLSHLILCSLLLMHPLFAKDPASFVNPFIGTDAHGHTYPGATVPFGMVQVSPDNGKSGWDWCSGYHASSDTIVGFSHTHLSGTGCADLGDILFTPTITRPNPKDLVEQIFSHADEEASPGFYSVRLQDGIRAELTATERGAMHRYSYPGGSAAFFVIDLGYGQDDSPQQTLIQSISDRIIQGYRYSSGWAPEQRIYFCAEFSRPFVNAEISGDGEDFHPAPNATGKRAKMLLSFGKETKEPLLVRVGISATSLVGAQKNLEKEIADFDFERVKTQAREKWNASLGRAQVEMQSEADRTTFYTALYHAFLAPTLFNDADKSYRGGDGRNHEGDFNNYCTFSLWDTYRAAHPLYTILQPERVNDFVNSMLSFHDQHGNLPVWSLAGDETWCMIGYHSVPVIADAWKKGFRGFSQERAYAAMTASAGAFSRGLEFYNGVRVEPLELKRKELNQSYITPTQARRVSALSGNNSVLAGYSKTISGEKIHYHSSYPEVKDALISRATDGKMEVEWESEPLPANHLSDTVTLMWAAGHCAHWGRHRFDLYVNGAKWLNFYTSADSSRTSWQEKGDNGSLLTFIPTWRDVHQDHFGDMFLTIPTGLLKDDKAVRIKIAGENAGSSDWYMTFEHHSRNAIQIDQEYALASHKSSKAQFVRVQIESLVRQDGKTIFLAEPPMTIDGVLSEIGIMPGLNSFLVPIRAVDADTPVRFSCEVLGRRLDSIPAWRLPQEEIFKPIHPMRYMPADKVHESVSKTLEYAYDDWCIAEIARDLGRAEDAQYFADRATYWKSLFDSTTGFMRGRKFDGSWVSPFNPRFGTQKQPEYTEGNAWQYSWYVPHDVGGLIEAHGGNEQFSQKLDSLFEQDSNLEDAGATADMTGLIGLYAHGNEPSHHIAYLYNFCGQPWKTQKLVRKIMRDFYTDKTDGLCGNEDCGQMSAWYIFSALGFYPVNPADGKYWIGSPLVKSASLDVGEGKQFQIIVENQSRSNVYVQSAALNGRKLDSLYITHKEVMSGGELKFVMGDSPSK